MEIIRENEILRQRRMNLNMTQEKAAAKAQVDLPFYVKIENGDMDIRSAEFQIVSCILSTLKLNISDFYARRYRILNRKVVNWDDSSEPFGEGWQVFSLKNRGDEKQTD